MRYFVIIITYLIIPTLTAQNYTLKVWPDGAPDSNGITLPEEKYDGVRLRNVTEAEMHIFQKGGHGFGMRNNNIPADNWPSLFINWLKATDFLP